MYHIHSFYMAKCATCVFHEMDKRMENSWFLDNYNEAWKTHVAQLAMYNGSSNNYQLSLSRPYFHIHLCTVRLPDCVT